MEQPFASLHSCLPSEPCKPPPTSSPSRPPSTRSKAFAKLFPLNPWAAIALLPLLPKSCYINRGYTVWFHLLSLSFCLSRHPFLAQFLALQGLGITMGWTAALANDYLVHGRFFHILYRNMPAVLKAHMLHPSDNFSIVYNARSYAVMAFSHVLDILFHQILTLYFCRRHIKSSTRPAPSSAASRNPCPFTWTAIFSNYCLSRTWSSFHSYYNNGVFSLFYFGHDIYTLDDLNSWLPAYAAEGAMYVFVIAWKIYSP